MDLALQNDASIKSIFSVLNEDNGDYITSSQLQVGFKQFECDIQKDDLTLVMEKLDKDKDNKVSYEDIEEMFLPLQEQYAKLMSKKNFNPLKPLSKETKAIISKILFTIVKSEKEIELVRLKMSECSLQEYFALCDSLCLGRITEKEVALLYRYETCTMNWILLSHKNRLKCLCDAMIQTRMASFCIKRYSTKQFEDELKPKLAE